MKSRMGRRIARELHATIGNFPNDLVAETLRVSEQFQFTGVEQI
jgi:hypothetical protein